MGLLKYGCCTSGVLQHPYLQHPYLNNVLNNFCSGARSPGKGTGARARRYPPPMTPPPPAPWLPGPVSPPEPDEEATVFWPLMIGLTCICMAALAVLLLSACAWAKPKHLKVGEVVPTPLASPSSRALSSGDEARPL